MIDQMYSIQNGKVQKFLFGNKVHVLDRIHVHIVTLKCALSCQEGNVPLRKKLLTNADFLQDTVHNSCKCTKTFLQMNQKDLYASMAICICSSFFKIILVLQFWWNKVKRQCHGSKVGQKKCRRSVFELLHLHDFLFIIHQNDGLQMKNQRRQRPSQENDKSHKVNVKR